MEIALTDEEQEALASLVNRELFRKDLSLELAAALHSIYQHLGCEEHKNWRNYLEKRVAALDCPGPKAPSDGRKSLVDRCWTEIATRSNLNQLREEYGE